MNLSPCHSSPSAFLRLFRRIIVLPSALRSCSRISVPSHFSSSVTAIASATLPSLPATAPASIRKSRSKAANSAALSVWLARAWAYPSFPRWQSKDPLPAISSASPMTRRSAPLAASSSVAAPSPACTPVSSPFSAPHLPRTHPDGPSQKLEKKSVGQGLTGGAENHKVAAQLEMTATGTLFDRANFSFTAKPDQRAAGIAGRGDDVRHDGVHRGGESTNIGAGGHAGGRRSVRDVFSGGSGDAGNGLLRELSDRHGAGDVVERVLHVFGVPGDARSVADGAGRSVFFGRAVCAADGDTRAGADREQHSARIEACDGGRHRDVHRVRGIAQREIGGGKSRDVCRPRQFFRPRSASRLPGNRIDAGADGAASERRDPAGDSGDDAVWDLPGAGALAFGGAGDAAPFGYVPEAGFAGRPAFGAGGDHFHFSVRGSVRQRGHTGGRVRAGRIRQGWKDSAGGACVARGRRGHDVRGVDRNFDGDELYRKRRGSGGGCAHRAKQRDGSGAVSGGDVFFAGRRGNSGICDGACTNPGGRADDGIHRAGGLEGFQRSVSGVRDAGGHAADV